MVQELDATGRWISIYRGERLVGQPKFQMDEEYLSSALFARHLTILSDYLQRANTGQANEPR